MVIRATFIIFQNNPKLKEKKPAEIYIVSNGAVTRSWPIPKLDHYSKMEYKTPTYKKTSAKSKKEEKNKRNWATFMPSNMNYFGIVVRLWLFFFLCLFVINRFLFATIRQLRYLCCISFWERLRYKPLAFCQWTEKNYT